MHADLRASMHVLCSYQLKGQHMSIAFSRSWAVASLFVAFAMPVMAVEVPASLDGVKTVTAEQARDLATKGAPLIDARTANEYAEKTIKGSVNVPYKEKSAKAPDFDKSLDSFDLAKLPADKSKPVVMFCNAATCWKSYKASVYARDAGYKQIHWLRGGFPEWDSKGLPTQ